MWEPPQVAVVARHCDRHGWERVWSLRAWRQGCPVCLRERQRRQAARRAEVRNPPRPPHERTTGVCSLCGTSPLPPRRRSWCSDECVALWMLAASAEAARRHLFGLLGRVCWECETTEGAMYIDHVRPLWSLTATERGELRWWLPFNLQVLCRACHARKTKAEAAERAAVRAGA